MKKIFLLFAMGLAILNSSYAQTKDSSSFAFSLQQCIDFAYKNQSRVVNAAIDEKIAGEKVKEITGVGLPQLNGSLDVKDYVQIPTSLIPAQFFGGRPGEYFPVKFGTKYNTTAGVDASQLIFDGSYIVGLQASKTYKELSAKNLQRSKIEAAVAVSKAYYSVLINERRFELLKVNVERVKKLMDDTKVMYENGFAEKIDFSRVSVSYNNLVTEKDKIEKMLQLGYLVLKFQMGMDLNSKLTLTDNLNAGTSQLVNMAEEKVDYSKRIEYDLIQTQKRLYELDLKKNRYGYLPSLVAYGNLSANAQRQEFDFLDTKKKWFPIGIVGAKLTIPIFDGLQKNYRIQQSKLTLMKTINDAKMLEQSIDMEVKSARINYQNSLASLETQKKNIELAEEVYNVSKKKYEEGVGSNLEVVNADAALKEAQTNYYNAMYDALVAKIDLDKASGLIK